MAVLRVIVDNVLAPDPTGVNRYSVEITRGLIRTAPEDCAVVGVCAEHRPEELDRLRELLPGLADLIVLPASSAQLAFAWGTGMPPRMLPEGLTHSPTMLAPFTRHDHLRYSSEQVVATLHSAALWTAPETLTRAEAIVFSRTIRRAERYADALVVTNHSVADAVERFTSFGSRLRLVPAAPTPHLVTGGALKEKAREAGLPEDFLLMFAHGPAANLELSLAAYAASGAPLPLVIVGAQDRGQTPITELLDTFGLQPPRVLVLGVVDDSELSVALTKATALIELGTTDMVGLSLLDAQLARTPVVTSAGDASAEITGGAALTVPLDGTGAVGALADAIHRVSTDSHLRSRLRQEGSDWVKEFSWDQSAHDIWTLQADI